MRGEPKPTERNTFVGCDIRSFRYKGLRVVSLAMAITGLRCSGFLSGPTGKRGPATCEEVLSALGFLLHHHCIDAPVQSRYLLRKSSHQGPGMGPVPPHMSHLSTTCCHATSDVPLESCLPQTSVFEEEAFKFIVQGIGFQ